MPRLVSPCEEVGTCAIYIHSQNNFPISIGNDRHVSLRFAGVIVSHLIKKSWFSSFQEREVKFQDKDHVEIAELKYWAYRWGKLKTDTKDFRNMIQCKSRKVLDSSIVFKGSLLGSSLSKLTKLQILAESLSEELRVWSLAATPSKTLTLTQIFEMKMLDWCRYIERDNAKLLMLSLIGISASVVFFCFFGFFCFWKKK